MDPEPTISAVAKIAGVSKMTVSRVLRNYPSVSDATREKVLRAIEQTGYRINPMVSAFMRYVRHTHSIPATEDIACLSMKPAATVSEEHPALNKTQLLQGAKERAAEIGFGLEVIEVGPRGVGFRRAEEIIRARGIRGIIITPMPNPQSHLHLKWENYCVISITRSLLRPSLPQVLSDQYQSMLLALKELRRLGYCRIGLAMPFSHDQRVHYLWSAAYLAHHCCCHSDAHPPRFLPEKWTEKSFLKWWKKHRPDAVVSTDHRVLQWLRNAGCSIPEDVGFVDLEWNVTREACAGIDQQWYRQGREAINFLSERLYLNELGLLDNPQKILIEGQWVSGPTIRRQPHPVESA